jgi:outer membrane protein TolC
MKYFSLRFLGVCLFGISIFATHARAQQRLLTIDEAVRTLLEKNLDLKALQNEVAAAKALDFKGNAGETPTFSLNAGENLQVSGLNQRLLNGTEINRFGVFSNALNLSTTVSYPLFIGYRVEATKGRIKEQSTLADARVRSQAQNLVANLMQRYYELVRQNDFLKVLERSNAVSEKRLELVKTRISVGAANNSDLFLAQLDLNVRQQDIENQKVLIAQNQIEINNLMLSPSGQKFSVANEIPLVKDLKMENFIENIKNNIDLQTLESQIRISEFLEKETYANRLPSVRATGGVGYSLANSTAGFSLFSQNYGPNGGITFSMPLFQNQIFNKQHEAAKISTETRRLQQQALKENLIGIVFRVYESYKNAINRLDLEAENLKIAQQYLDLILKKYELSQATAIEIREAQRTFEDAAFRLIALRFQAKQAEIELLRVSGELVK